MTIGTIFQDARIPLRSWFQAMWWVTAQKSGASALGLLHILGLNRYETAWTMLHRLGRAMVSPGRDLLSGRVEVDAYFLGGLGKDLPLRLQSAKTLMVVAAQEEGLGIGRIRMRQIPDTSAASLVPFLRDSIAPRSVVNTRGWMGNLSLESIGFAHHITDLEEEMGATPEPLPRVHLVISMLKRWLMALHEGRAIDNHLDFAENQRVGANSSLGWRSKLSASIR